MKFPLSFGKIEIKYILMIGFAISFYFLGKLYFLYSDEKFDILKVDKEDKEEKKDKKGRDYTQNILLKSLLKYIGFSLMIIGDIIIKKLSFKNKKNDIDKKILLSKEYNLTKEDSKYLIKKKDILFIILISLAHLADDFLAILIKRLINETSIDIDERYNISEFIFLFFTSLYIFKIHYYKHQYISIIIIISLEIFRYIIKEDEYNDFIEKTGLQMIRAIIDSLFIGYSKGLMEYKFFSPYKALYIFGFINGIIMIIIYCIVSFKPVKNDDFFCCLKYENKCYIDNFKSIFKGFNFIQFLGLFLNMISVGATQLLFNAISNDFTICHIFIYYTVNSLYKIIKTFNDYKKVFPLLIISNIFEIFTIFVFLEIIVINLWGLNKNIKINIEKRALLDIETNERNINNSFDINDEYEINYVGIDKNKNSLKETPLLPINDIEDEEEK